MLLVSPVFEYEVSAVVALESIRIKLPVHAILVSILYPVRGLPPLLSDGNQLRSICDEDIVVAFNALGRDGTVEV